MMASAGKVIIVAIANETMPSKAFVLYRKTLRHRIN
jgi:hypothetical protein